MRVPICIAPLLILVFYPVVAQEYYPFPHEDVSWNVHLESTCDNDTPPKPVLQKYTIRGDTIIDEIAYHKLCLEMGTMEDPVYESVGGLREEDRMIYYMGRDFLGKE